MESLLKAKNPKFPVLQKTLGETEFQVCTCRLEVYLTQMDAIFGGNCVKL